MNSKELAQKLTEDLFNIGGRPDSPCNRIQFMGGSYFDDKEVGQGGLCKDAFEYFVAEKLESYFNQSKDK